MRKTFLTILVATILALAAFVPAASADQPRAIPAAEIVTIPVDAASPAFVDALLAHGFRGVAGDGQEAIYAPREAAQALACTDADGALVDGRDQR